MPRRRSSKAVPGRELVNAADIGRRLGLTSERVRQLARERELPAPLGRVSRNDIWDWEEVAAWAIATGRVSASPDQPVRRAPTIWLAEESPDRRLVVDDVLAWDDLGSVVHVRIWEPTSDSAAGPVVILGNLADNEGRSVTNDIEEIVDAVQNRWLGDRAVHADWIEYWPAGAADVEESEFKLVSFEIAGAAGPEEIDIPPRSLLRSPVWHDVSRRQVERLVGTRLPTYDVGTYNVENVSMIARRGAPIEVVWDPHDVRVITDAVAALESHRDSVPADQDVYGFDLALHLLAVRAGDAMHDTRNEVDAQGKGWSDPPVRKVAPHLSDDDLAHLKRWRDAAEFSDAISDGAELHRAAVTIRDWLAENDATAAEMLLPGRRGLAWPEPWMAGALELGDRPDDSDADQLTTAMRWADRLVSMRLWHIDQDGQYPDHPVRAPSSPMSASGRHTRRYLETVSWYGPIAGDELRKDQLVRWLDSPAQTRFGYDPWRRAVVHAPEPDLLVVEWPLVPPENPPPDDARLVATDDHPNGPVFVAMPDGRLDLLCAVPDGRMLPGMTFGYYGTGPNRLAAAIYYLLGGPIRVRGPDTQEQREGGQRLVPLLAETTDYLDLAVGDLRQTLQDLLP